MKKIIIFCVMALTFLNGYSCKKVEMENESGITQFHFDNKNEGTPALLQSIDLTDFQGDYFCRALLQDSVYLTEQNTKKQNMVGVLIPIKKFATDNYSSELIAMGYQVPSLNEFLSFISQHRMLFDKVKNFDQPLISVSCVCTTDLSGVQALMHHNYGGRPFSDIITFKEVRNDVLTLKDGEYKRTLYLRESQEVQIQKNLENNYNFVFGVKKTLQNNSL